MPKAPMPETPEPESPWTVYLLRCADGTLYCGITTDLERRVAEHNAGTASKYTRARLPVTVAASVQVNGKSAALKLEMAVKKQPRGAKADFLRLHVPGRNRGD